MLNQIVPAVYDRPNALTPCALCDGDGNVVLLTKVKNEHQVETLMRTVTTEMGSSAALVTAPLNLADLREYGVLRTQSQAWWIGRAIALCNQKNRIGDVASEICGIQGGKCLFKGKIVDVKREVSKGFTWGEVTIARLQDDEVEEEEEKMVIPFQNENLAAYIGGTMKAIVPDLICVLDSQSGCHLGTQMYTYGLRVTGASFPLFFIPFSTRVVIVLAGSPLWTTEEGLRVGGPEAFGLKDKYVPGAVGEYKIPRSVIEVYGSK